MYVSILSWLFLSFFFVVCIPSGVTASVHLRFFLLIRLSVLPDFVSLHEALLFLPSFWLVRSRFGTSNVLLAIRLPGQVLLVGFLSFAIFVFGSFHLRDAALFNYPLNNFNLLCLVSSTSLFSGRVSLFFSFSIRRSRYRCFISCFCMILSPYFTLLAASLSFSFFICAGLSSSLPVLSVSLSSLPSVVSCRVFRALFANFLSCSISWL